MKERPRLSQREVGPRPREWCLRRLLRDATIFTSDDQGAQERQSASAVLGGHDLDAEDLSVPVPVHAGGDACARPQCGHPRGPSAGGRRPTRTCAASRAVRWHGYEL